MSKLGTILKAVGRGAVLAAGFTPAGSAVTAGLRIGGMLLNNSSAPVMDFDGDDSGNLHELAVQSVLDNLPAVIGLYDRSAVKIGLDAYLSWTTDQVHQWLKAEAMKYAVADTPAHLGTAS